MAEDVKNYPDDYQYERAARFGVCQKAIWQALKKLDVTYKRALKQPKANEGARQSFRKGIKALITSGKNLVYVDESGFAHDMPRTHGYAPKGQRCFGVQDWGAKGRTNVIGALLAGVLLTSWLCDFNVDGDVFHASSNTRFTPQIAARSGYHYG